MVLFPDLRRIDRFEPAEQDGTEREAQMHILITGAAGMIGRKLTARLVKDGKLNGAADRPADADRRGRRRSKPAGFTGKVEIVDRRPRRRRASRSKADRRHGRR